jgi:hypothetical protein
MAAHDISTNAIANKVGKTITQPSECKFPAKHPLVAVKQVSTRLMTSVVNLVAHQVLGSMQKIELQVQLSIVRY